MKYCATILIIAALIGCQSTSPSVQLTELAISTPGHLQDWKSFAQELERSGLHCVEGPSSLGTLTLMVSKEDFDHASSVSERIIQDNNLTLRLVDDVDSHSFGVYESGRKKRVEKYIAENAEPDE